MRSRIILGTLISLTLANAQGAERATGPVLISASSASQIGAQSQQYPLFQQELERARNEVEAAIQAGIDVPTPKDPGGGYTHEQHKRNYKSIYQAGLLYRITGEQKYADFVRRLLLAYVDLCPKLGPHPAAANQTAGRLFWQSLNDSVWLVHAAQGYDAVRDVVSAQDRQVIDEKVFRVMAKFLSDDSPEVFNRIHNHATWANAAVGMTGYVLRERELVDKALLGLDRSGKAGFLKQLDLLFSPDGYYTEGPYYQRYALLPFVIFAQAIQNNQPERKIFEYRDGIVLKAIRTTVQLTYDGYFFPLNDAMPDKSLKTDELYQAVATAYQVTGDPALLSIAQWQGRVVLAPEGFAVARDIAAGKAKPFAFASQLLRDGPQGDQGALAILRAPSQTLVMKNTAQGMGHGHFDKLNWLLYDSGNAIVTDYGSARFLNIQAKEGGRYLRENESWAKQTIAHNTLVVNERSHFDCNLKTAEQNAPKQLFFAGQGATQLSTAEMSRAYPGVTFRRTLAQLTIPGYESPLVIDVLRAKSETPAQFDLPLHYSGHLIDVAMTVKSNVAARPVLGRDHGYQHLWVDAVGAPSSEKNYVTWLNDGRFYTYRTVPPSGAEMIFAESGANDPSFNLRREPVLIQRVANATNVTFVSLLEPHGRHDGANEMTVGSQSGVRALRHTRTADSEVVHIELENGKSVILAIADAADGNATHSVNIAGRALTWQGHVGRFDL
ncbi:MAG TPA: alginate lyase family protein [Steroidobacter sp.]|uniref:alginate lyase family protein n=1 Tax=Steroidobacter sp. TaxID=1978227 RepID=UPI002EDA5DAA